MFWPASIKVMQWTFNPLNGERYPGGPPISFFAEIDAGQSDGLHRGRSSDAIAVRGELARTHRGWADSLQQSTNTTLALRPFDELSGMDNRNAQG
jgi:hypothetical protein